MEYYWLATVNANYTIAQYITRMKEFIPKNNGKIVFNNYKPYN